MSTKLVKFNKVEVGAFVFIPLVGWAVKISRRRCTSGGRNVFDWPATCMVEVLA